MTWLKIGLVKSIQMSETADSSTSFKMSQFISLVSSADSETRSKMTPFERPDVQLSGDTDADSSTVLSVKLTVVFRGESSADSESVINAISPLPVLTEPTVREIPGAINLVLNPSLEVDDVGTRGWTNVGGTLSRNDSDSWSGLWSALVLVPAGVGEVEIFIRSADGLSIEDVTPFVGSVYLEGDAAAVSVRLRITYLDGSTADFPPSLDPSDDPFVLSDISWGRAETEMIENDPAKSVNFLELIITVPQEASDVWIRADGAQIQMNELTTYVDGDQGAGHHWFGAPGFSVSWREPMTP